MSALAHTYRYDQPSQLTQEATPRLYLATSASDGLTHPYFFRGTIKTPRLCANLLSAVHLIVGARFFIPPNSMQRMLAQADPVVTSGGGLLRFEGFSGCCSAYIRVDLLPESYDGELVSKGCTNVDFNAPMKSALAGVRDQDSLRLQVGPDALMLERNGDATVEKKVALPLRWLRGMLEVHAYQQSMRPLFSVNRIEAVRFLHSLPRASTSRTPLWIGPGARGLFSSTQPNPGSVRVVDSRRLQVLEGLLPQAKQLTVYADEQQQANAWVLDLPGARLTLALSAEVWRGFSGEGQALRDLMQADNLQRRCKEVRASLNWQSGLKTEALATQLGRPLEEIRAAFSLLGASGLVGYDLAQACHFHRELPFNLELLEDMHPRLASARELLASGAVRVQEGGTRIDAYVASKDTEHHVTGELGELSCTCPWYAKYQGLRGPCKHILAVEVAVDEQGKVG